MGGDLGGRFPPTLRWGKAHASVSPIFGKVALWDAREKYEVTKKGEMNEFFVVK